MTTISKTFPFIVSSPSGIPPKEPNSNAAETQAGLRVAVAGAASWAFRYVLLLRVHRTSVVKHRALVIRVLPSTNW